MKRQRDKRKRKNKLALMFLAFLMIYAGFILIDQQRVIMDKNQNIRDLEKEIQMENAIKAELNNILSRVNSDEYIEEVAREKLGLVGKDDIIFIDVNNN